ncbi:MAG: efflux RND transporter periplasmic adaptor subunit [Oligoflexia bacterium]|nr:efflux RND transporter periplasmic adaptor subunit [Oligoflexia bacterium]
MIRQFVVSVLLVTSQAAWAHEGHDHAPGTSEQAPVSGPIVITQQSRTNLGLQVVTAQVRSMDKAIRLIGQIEPIPARLSAVTSRISGRVTALYVSEGDGVKKGQPLIEVESRQPGEPPPRVKYFAPIDGIITDNHAVIGDTVEPDKHLMQVVDLQEVYAEGRVYEGQVEGIRIGQHARVQVESYPRDRFLGVVELLGGSLDPETRTLKMWVRMPNPDLKLRPNMRATLDVIAGQTEAAIVVPQSAVLGELGNYFVFVQSESSELEFERRPVVVGVSDGSSVEIVEGVLPEEKVVSSGNYQLQYVNPTAPEGKAEAPSSKQAPANSSCAMIYGIIGVLVGAGVTFLLGRRVS